MTMVHLSPSVKRRLWRKGREEEGGHAERERRQGRPKASRRCKMRHRNPRGTQIRKLGVMFKFGQLIMRKINEKMSPDVIL